MQMIHDAIKPEALEQFKKFFSEPMETIPEAKLRELKALQLDKELRVKRDQQAELDDRNRHERRKAEALARHG